jgi:hypothetical protein
MEVVAARYIRVVGGILIVAAGIALSGWVLFGLSLAPGSTIGAKWEQFSAGSSNAPMSISLLVYEAALLAWFFCLLWFRKTERLLRLGKPAAAVVIDIRKIIVPTVCTPDFIVTINFHDNAGNLVEGKISDRLNFNETFAGHESSHFSVSQVLTVLYDPAEPTEYLLYPPPGYEVGMSVGS